MGIENPLRETEVQPSGPVPEYEPEAPATEPATAPVHVPEPEKVPA